MTWGALKRHLNAVLPDNMEIGWIRLDPDTRLPERIMISNVMTDMNYPATDALSQAVHIDVPHVNITDYQKVMG